MSFGFAEGTHLLSVPVSAIVQFSPHRSRFATAIWTKKIPTNRLFHLPFGKRQLKRQKHDDPLIESLSRNAGTRMCLAKGFYHGSVGFRPEELRKLTGRTKQSISQGVP